MLQHMPTPGEHVAIEEGISGDGLLRASDILDGDENENWNRVNLLLDTADELEMVGPLLDPGRLIQLLFHEESPRIFGCTCSEDRVRQSLSIYSAKDIGHMTTKDNKVTADCQFCGSHYTFEPSTLGFEANSTD